MAKKFSLEISGILLMAGFLIGCKPSSEMVKPHGYFQTHFQDESQFIVETIVSDLAEQVFYAKFHQLPDAKYFSVSATEKPDSDFPAPSYELQINLDRGQRVTAELNINGPIWSPEIYESVAAVLAQKVGLETIVSDDDSEDTDLLEKLSNGTAATLEEQNQNLSKSLENDFDNPVWIPTRCRLRMVRAGWFNII